MALPKDQVKFTLEQIGYQKPFTVIFLKADGTQRQMTCMMDVPTGPSKNPDVVPVMDLEKGAWRSFRLDSVLYIQ